MSEQKVGCVPDGYMPIPTAEQIADALESVRCFHDMSAELIAPELLVNLLGAPTVKAEQADEAKRIDKQCRDDVAAALGFVSGGNFAWSYLLTQIKECVRVAEAPSLPAAGSAEEEVEVVAWRYRHSEQEKWQTGVERKSLWETEPLMTVAQHKRLMAAEIQKRFDGNEQSSREHREELAQLAARDAGEVRVPVELLEDLRDLAIDAAEHHRAAYASHKPKRQASIDRTVEAASALLAKREREGE